MVRSSYVRKLRFNDVGFWFVIVIYFVLLDNYVTLGLQKHIILIKSDIRQFLYFLAMYGKYVITTLLLVLSIYCIFSYVRIMLSMLLCFMTLGLRSFVVCCITYGNNVWNNIWKLRFVFVCHCDVFFFFFWPNYVICLFDVVTFLDDVSITLHFVTFEFRMEMTWKLCFVFVCHYDVFFILSQLHYLFVPCSYILWWR